MTAIFVIAAVAGLVWSAVVLRQTGLLGGCLAVLLVGSCLGPEYFRLDAGPLPVTADRVLWVALAVAFLGYRHLGRTARRPLDHHDILALAFFGVLALSALTHDWQAGGGKPLARLLFYYLMPLVVYGIASRVATTPRAVRAMFAALAVFGLYLAVTAIAERYELAAFVFPRYVVSSANTEFLGRGRGPFLNPPANGMYLCAGLFGLLMHWPQAGRIGRLALIAAALLILIGIHCTLTRSVWLGAALGLVVLVGLSVPRRWRIGFLAAVAVASLVLVTAKWDDWRTFRRDKFVSAAEMSESASLRPILAMVAWKMFLDRPLWGCGLGQYERARVDYLADRSTDLPLQRAGQYVQHNVLLSLLTETGLVGAGLFVLLLVAWARTAWRLWAGRDGPLPWRQQGLLFLALLAAYLANAMFHDLTIAAMVNMLVFFLAGVTRGLLPARGGEEFALARPPRARLVGERDSSARGGEELA